MTYTGVAGFDISAMFTASFPSPVIKRYFPSTSKSRGQAREYDPQEIFVTSVGARGLDISITMTELLRFAATYA